VPDPVDDVLLVRRVDKGDTEALRVLYERYGGVVFGMTYRVLGDRHAAEECTQDVFVSVWRTSGSYDPGRAGVSTWLLTIARNRAIDAARRRISAHCSTLTMTSSSLNLLDRARLATPPDAAQGRTGGEI